MNHLIIIFITKLELKLKLKLGKASATACLQKKIIFVFLKKLTDLKQNFRLLAKGMLILNVLK